MSTRESRKRVEPADAAERERELDRNGGSGTLPDTAGDRPTAIVYIVDDERDARDSLEFLLGGHGFQTRAFASAAEFLKAERPEDVPQCLILDLRLVQQAHDISGIRLKEELQKQGKRIPTIMVTAYAEIPTTVRAMQAGIIEFLEKPFEASVLLQHIRTALDSDAAERAKEVRQAELDTLLADLTPRERQVMDHIVRGLQTKAIADSLRIQSKTVESHRNRLYRKLGVSTSLELILLWAEAGHQLPSFSERHRSLLDEDGGVVGESEDDGEGGSDDEPSPETDGDPKPRRKS